MAKNKKKLSKNKLNNDQSKSDHPSESPEPQVSLTPETNDIVDNETPTDNGNNIPENGSVNGTDHNDRITELLEQLKLKDQKIQQLSGDSDTIESLKTKIQQQEDIIQELKSTRNNTENEVTDNSSTNEQVEAITKERDEIKASYDSLLSRISSMKSVFSKMKENESELEELRSEVDNYKQENSKLSSSVDQLKEQTNDLNNECDRLTNLLTVTRKELQQKEDSVQDEKYELENTISKLNKKVADLRSHINELELGRDENVMETKNLNSIIEELKETVNIKQADIDNLKTQLTFSINKTSELQAEMNQSSQDFKHQIETLELTIAQLKQEKDAVNENHQQSLEKIAELEKTGEKIKELENDVNTKQILLGKARHEAIILNEHLSKALGMLKQQSNNLDNTIDKELVSNVIINFLQIPRGDTKKFEALQLISSLLEWDESKRVASGLSHQQGKIGDGSKSRESFISLWTDFLERESTKK